MSKHYLAVAALILCGFAGLVQAQSTPQPISLPAWEQLTPAQREELIDQKNTGHALPFPLVRL